MKSFKSLKILILSLLIASLAHGCDVFDGKDKNNENRLLLGLALLNQGNSYVGDISFEAKFGERNIECGDSTYTLPNGQIVQLRDLRFFIQEINLINFDNTKSSVQILPVDFYQVSESRGSVALLDFSTGGSGKCIGTSDNAETHTKLRARIPNGTFKGVEFVIGVPNALNHINRDIQASTSPLKNGTGMPWGWQAGYKYIRFELSTAETTSTNFQFHLGSTSCTGDINIPFGEEGSVSCANNYRPTIRIESEQGFNPNRDIIRLQTEKFFQDGLTTYNFSSGTALSCMPGTNIPCQGILQSLGLRGGDDSPGEMDSSLTQSVFGIVKN